MWPHRDVTSVTFTDAKHFDYHGYEFFNLTMVQIWYIFNSKQTLSFTFWLFPALLIHLLCSLLTLGIGIAPNQLCGHEGKLMTLCSMLHCSRLGGLNCTYSVWQFYFLVFIMMWSHCNWNSICVFRMFKRSAHWVSLVAFSTAEEFSSGQVTSK